MPQRRGGSASPKDRRVYLVYGTDEYLVSDAARRIVAALCPEEERVFGLEEVPGEAATIEEAVRALRQCLVAVRTVGFFGGRKTVWFRNVDFLKNTVLTGSKAVQPWLAELVALIRGGLPEGHRLLVTAPEVDGRSALVRACREAGEVQEYSVATKAYQRIGAARAQAQAFFTEAGLRLEGGALDVFLDRVGADTRIVASEVEKLRLYVGARKTVTPADVRAVASPHRVSEGWDLADAVGARDPAAALALVRQLLFQRVDWVVLMGGLEGRFRDLAVFRDCLDRGWVRMSGRQAQWRAEGEAEALLGALGARDPRSYHPYRAGRLVEQADRFTAPEIEGRRRLILETRERMVSGTTAPEVLLEFLVLRLAGRGGRPARMQKRAV